MRIREIMSSPAITCRENDTLNTAARLMWENDCGAVPVTDDDGRIAGMVTDRDICMATYTRNKAPQAIGVSEAMARQVFSCRAEDPVDAAERLMREKQVRRVPIVDSDNRPQAVLSMNDIARAAARKKDGFDRAAIETLAAICEPRLPKVRQQQAAKA
jgi:CBS domain-containing protein